MKMKTTTTTVCAAHYFQVVDHRKKLEMHSSIHQFVIHQMPQAAKTGALACWGHHCIHSSINATSSEDLSLGMLGPSMHSSIHHPRQHQQLTRNPLESSFVRHPSSRHHQPSIPPQRTATIRLHSFSIHMFMCVSSPGQNVH